MPTLEAASSVQCLHVVDERPGIDVAEPVHIDTGPLADLEGRGAREARRTVDGSATTTRGTP
jgi:hypothetical protein